VCRSEKYDIYSGVYRRFLFPGNMHSCPATERSVTKRLYMSNVLGISFCWSAGHRDNRCATDCPDEITISEGSLVTKLYDIQVYYLFGPPISSRT
jgi:hypothetical protein